MTKKFLIMKKTEEGKKSKLRLCNICNNGFKAKTPFDRFCHSCKEQSEILKFSSCLPEIDESIFERISA